MLDIYSYGTIHELSHPPKMIHSYNWRRASAGKIRPYWPT